MDLFEPQNQISQRIGQALLIPISAFLLGRDRLDIRILRQCNNTLTVFLLFTAGCGWEGSLCDFFLIFWTDTFHLLSWSQPIKDRYYGSILPTLTLQTATIFQTQSGNLQVNQLPEGWVTTSNLWAHWCPRPRKHSRMTPGKLNLCGTHVYPSQTGVLGTSSMTAGHLAVLLR